MKPLPRIHNLSQTVSMFNQGCASFEQAMSAVEDRNYADFQTSLQRAARDVADTIEWALKAYLDHFPDLPPEDRRKLNKPNFYDLIVLMEKWANPAMDRDARRRLEGYRKLRNKVTHEGAIPPFEEVRNAIQETRQIILTYFPEVEAGHLQTFSKEKESNVLVKAQGVRELIRNYERRLQKLQEQKSKFGLNTAPEILMEIEDIEAEIKRLQATIVSESAGPIWPTTLPWNDPYYRLPERDGELDLIVQHLIKKETQWGVFVSGLGGIGKTATAIEIGRRCMAAHAFERVLGDSAKLDFLVDGRVAQADDKAVLNFENFLNELGTQLDRPELRLKPFDEKRHVLSRLLDQAPYLVIVDNLETVQNATQIVRDLPQLLGRSRAIITSREVISANTLPLILKGLGETDSLFFLREDAQTRQCEDVIKASDAVLREVHQAVEGQPLALKLIVGQAANFGLDYALAHIKNTRGDIYRFIYWDSWQKLSLPAQEMLIYLGGAPTSVSLNELLDVPFSIDHDDLTAAINQLIKLSLINVSQPEGKKRYAIHELTRSFVNSDLPELWGQQGMA